MILWLYIPYGTLRRPRTGLGVDSMWSTLSRDAAVCLERARDAGFSCSGLSDWKPRRIELERAP